MKKIRLMLNALAVLAVCFLFSSMAQAQATRTWVSGVGDDANPCSRTAPCKTFAGAISKTAAGGEISVLDPGGFGAVTITKAITIDGGGIIGSIVVPAGTSGVIVNAGVNDTVRLRNLSINGAGTGVNGIRYLAGKFLHVENVNIQALTAHGIDMNLGANTGSLMVKDTNINNCGATGIRIQTSTGTATASIDHTRLQTCQFGLDSLSGTTTISNSVVSHNITGGIVAEFASVVNVDGTMISNNGTGVNGFSGTAVIRLSNSCIFNNNIGINQAAGTTVSTFQNNRFAGNTTPGATNQNLSQQ